MPVHHLLGKHNNNSIYTEAMRSSTTIGSDEVSVYESNRCVMYHIILVIM